MLEGAPAALAENGAGRGLPVRRRLQDLQRLREGEGFLALRDARADPLARQRALDEHHKAVRPRQRPALGDHFFGGQFRCSRMLGHIRHRGDAGPP